MMKAAAIERCVHTESTGFLPKRGLNVKRLRIFFQEDQSEGLLRVQLIFYVSYQLRILCVRLTRRKNNT